MASVTIDGQTIEFKPGETIIQVAERSGIEIAHYCWHPRLSVAANCRMCLVEVEKAPKLVPACQTECRDGMVVRVKNERVKDAQRSVHEFLLINHPIDCPICDQAGECKLQDYFMKFQLQPSRMAEQKVHKPRLEQLGPYVLYNGERCILCTRCIRFMEEIAKDRQLGVFERGDHARIGTFPGKTLDNPYSLNTVDVCPVGALTSSVFRFKQRVWNLKRSPSLCPGCARGCNVHVDQRSGVVYRLLPRENEEVNQSWLCDEGRLTYQWANDGRLTRALLGGAEPREVLGREAVAEAARLLKPLCESGAHLAVAVSLSATCEEAYLVGRLAKELFKLGEVGLIARADGDGDALLRLADKNPNRAGVTRVLADLGLGTYDEATLRARLAQGAIKALLLVGHEAADAAALAQAAARLEVLVQIAARDNPIGERAHVLLPALPWVQQDGTWLSGTGRLQRLTPAFPPAGEAKAAHLWLMELGAGCGLGFTYPSVQTIRAEMARQLGSFKDAQLPDVGPLGRQLG